MGLVRVKLSKKSVADLQIVFFALALILFILVQISQGDDALSPAVASAGLTNQSASALQILPSQASPLQQGELENKDAEESFVEKM